MTLTADFELGTNGSNVSASDAGSQSAWDVVTTGGGPITYSNTRAYGTLSVSVPADPSTPSLEWRVATFGTQTEYWGRMYLYSTSFPLAQFDLLKHLQTGIDLGWLIAVDTSGIMTINNRFGTIGTFTNAFALNQWIRIEWHAKHTATTVCEVKLFNSADSTTVTETQTINGGDILGNVNNFRLAGGSSGPLVFWADQVVDEASAYPGPFPVNTAAPAVSGSTPVGSTLSATTGTWNGGATFTFTYQWTRAGVNIGGATGSTYVSQAGDSGSAVACKVTATGQQATNESATQASSNSVTVTAAAASSPTVSGPPPLLGRMGR